MTPSDPFHDPFGETPEPETSTAEPWPSAESTPVAEPAEPAEPAERGQTAPVVRPLGRRLVALVMAASLASAGLAAAATVIVVDGTRVADPAATAAAPASTATAVQTSTGASANVTPGESIVQIASKATPAVVTIDTTVSSVSPFGGSTGGTGSGFIYDSNGLILTNDHVIEGADQITVTLLDGRHFTGTVVATDATLDLAIVKVQATGLPTLTLGAKDELQVGETLVAIGSPLGTYTGSVTSGILSATDRTITVQDELTRRPHQLTGLLQTDAAINPGNSGGPIIDGQGNVVGIATATSTSAEGLGFAIPITTATKILSSVKSSTT